MKGGRYLIAAVIALLALAAAIIYYQNFFYFSNPNLDFVSSKCNSSINAFNSSEMGVKESAWTSDNALQVKAYVSVNCGERIVGGDYEVQGDKIVLKYKSPRCGGFIDACMLCMCAHELTYKITSLEKKDYAFELERVY